MKVKLNQSFNEPSLDLGLGITISQGEEIDAPDTTEVKEALDNGNLEEIKQKTQKEDKIQEGKEIWVFAEQRNNKITRVAFELVGKASELASKLNVKTAAILIAEKDIGAQELIDFGADMTLLEPNYGQNCLHIASSGGYNDIVELILSKKLISINDVDRDGWTPIKVSKYKNKTVTTSLLMKYIKEQDY